MTVHGPRTTEAKQVERYIAGRDKRKSHTSSAQSSLEAADRNQRKVSKSKDTPAPVFQLPSMVKRPVNLGEVDLGSADDDRKPELKLISDAPAPKKASLADLLEANSKIERKAG